MDFVAIKALTAQVVSTPLEFDADTEVWLVDQWMNSVANDKYDWRLAIWCDQCEETIPEL